MNEFAARQAVKKFIVDNKETITEDVIALGEQREIVQVSTSRLTAEYGYYFISVYATSGEETDYSDTIQDISVSTLEMIISVADHIIINPLDEEESFESMDADMQIVTDRIVNLLRQQTYLQYIDTENNAYRFKLELPRRITKQNEYIPTNWNDTNMISALISTDIKFRIQVC